MAWLLKNIAAFVVAAVTSVAAFFSPAHSQPAPTISIESPAVIATTTAAQKREPAAATSETEPHPAASKPAPPETTTPVQTPAVVSTPQSPTPAEASTTVPVPPSWDTINTDTRAATVNIICTSAQGGLVEPISGSGVFIDPRGVILTDAHVAQYFLIKNYPAKGFLDCTIRQGSPATARYKAELLYISTAWVETHYDQILQQNPTGTGEDDFALLLVTGPTGPSVSVPTSFPYLQPALVNTPDIVGTPILVSAYPAGFLGGTTIQTGLSLTTAPATINDVYTFGTTTVDVLSLGGNIDAQHGSSGGAVVTGDGKLVGLVVTSTEAQTTGERDLNAITISHINRQMERELGVSLQSFLSNNVQNLAAEFDQSVAPELAQPLIKTLEQATARTTGG